jgi:ketosteroid isomerase-like protein
VRRAVLCLLLLTCSHPPPPRPTVEVEPPKTPAQQIEARLATLYAALEAGDADRVAPLLTPDAMVFGLGPSDTYSRRDTFLIRLAQQLLPLGLGDSLKIASSKPVVGLAPGSTSAWVFDFPRVTVTHKGSPTEWLPRLSAHLVLDGADWKLDALHVSLGIDDEVVFAPDAAKKLLPPNDVLADRGPDSEELVGLTRRLLEDFEVKIDRTTEREEFVQIGTSPAEVFEQGPAFKALVRPQLPAIRKGGYQWKIDGNLRVHRAPDGKTGWAAANVVLRIGVGTKRPQTLPAFRTLWIFVNERDRWNLASEHQSLAVKEDLLSPATAEQRKAWSERRAPKPSKQSAPDAGTTETLKAW